MPGLIQKSGYIKPGNGGSHYAEYIATREGVELIEAPPPSHDGGDYLEYMAQRPRSHGLFSTDGPADLEQTMEEINGHAGPVWTFVYSLKREDAHRLGYENSESWRRLLLAHQTELAQAMKISPNSFRWRAAFHDEKHHPQFSLVCRLSRRKAPPPHPPDGLVGGPQAGVSHRKGHRKDALPAVK